MTFALEVTYWQDSLNKGNYDPEVGISLAPLAGDETFTTYISEIAPYKQVEAHYHPEGVEIYNILSGQGEIHSGYIDEQGEVIWNEPTLVKKGSFFTILPRMVHQLKNPTSEPLILIVSCPPHHLGQNRVRVKSV